MEKTYIVTRRKSRSIKLLDQNTVADRPVQSINNEKRCSEPLDKENAVKRIRLDEESLKTGTGQRDNAKKRRLAHQQPLALPTNSEEVEAPKDAVTANGEWFNNGGLDLDYPEDNFKFEIALEKKSVLSTDYCKRPNFVITRAHRDLTIDWLIELQLCTKQSNEVLHLSVTLMDLFLDKENVTQDEIQSIAAAAFWLAIKYYRRGMKAKYLMKHVADLSKTALMYYERRILVVMGFNLMLCQPMNLLHYYLWRLFGPGSPPLPLYHAVCYLLELMLLRLKFIHQSQSTKVPTALLTVLRLFKESKAEEALTKLLTLDQRENIPKNMERAFELLRLVSEQKLYQKTSCLFRKYSSSQYSEIATNPTLRPSFRP